MHYYEREIIAWLCVLVGGFFIAKAVVTRRDRNQMRELLGLPSDKVKHFRNLFLQRLERVVGFLFLLVGVGLHLYVVVRRGQKDVGINDPREALDKARHGPTLTLKRGELTHHWTTGLTSPMAETPYDQTRGLFEEYDAYLKECGMALADHVIRMHEYLPEEVTREARAIAREHPLATSREPISSMQPPVARAPLAESFDPSRGRKEIRITAKGRDLLLYGTSEIDLRAVEQLLEPSQVRATGLALLLATERFMGESTPLRVVLDELDTILDERGLDILDPFGRNEAHPGALARPRRHEIAAALNRLRDLRVCQIS